MYHFAGQAHISSCVTTAATLLWVMPNYLHVLVEQQPFLWDKPVYRPVLLEQWTFLWVRLISSIKCWNSQFQLLTSTNTLKSMLFFSIYMLWMLLHVYYPSFLFSFFFLLLFAFFVFFMLVNY